MSKTIIQTENAPRAIGPYSQAVRVGNFLYTSGQIPLHPTTGEMTQGTIEIETQQVMDNLAAVLGAAGASWGDVIKTTIFLTNLSDFTTVNSVYGAHFPENPPARSTVQVAALPRGARVEIEAIAYLK